MGSNILGTKKEEEEVERFNPMLAKSTGTIYTPPTRCFRIHF